MVRRAALSCLAVAAVRPVLSAGAKATLDEQVRRMDRRYHEAAGG